MTTISTLSRRALVASAAALPALAVPAVASVANPDAELLRLGAEFERVEQEWLARRVLDRKWSAASERAREAAGLPYKKHSDFDDYEDFIAYNKKCGAVPYEGKEEEEADYDDNGVLIGWTKIQDRQRDLTDQILKHPPATAAGLAVLMRAFILDNEEWWSADADNEEYVRLRSFLEPICAFLDIKPAPLQEFELTEEA